MAYAYFSLTLLGIFAEEVFGRRGRSAAAPGPDGDPELLAEARTFLCDEKPGLPNVGKGARQPPYLGAMTNREKARRTR
ncbi:hypothetical protein ACFYM0_03655 [Streptomyces sp. NPDC006487]|uniref:hypothetical protein n=1 Tax=Streptomyces sp. NPDC006487 TaxID=3364748 RepID=UPI003683C64A